jgi:hypothetical protein
MKYIVAFQKAPPQKSAVTESAARDFSGPTILPGAPRVSPPVSTEPAVKKTLRKNWPLWAMANDLKTGQRFRVRYGKDVASLRGLWENSNYFLCSERVAPTPAGREAEAALNGWGSPIKWHAPTHAVSLVKMSFGANVAPDKRGPSAVPYELEYLLPTGRWKEVYDD